MTSIRCSGCGIESFGVSGGALVSRSNFRHSLRRSFRYVRVTIFRT